MAFGMPNVVFKFFSGTNIGTVYPVPWCLYSSVRQHQKLLETSNSRPRAKWRVMANTEESATVEETQKKSPSGRGFGKGGAREKDKIRVVRRAPSEKSLITPRADPQAQKIETALIISWAGLGILFLVEGIVLSASGLLPEDWDTFLVKYLYPSFTPTALLLLVGAVSYGLYKYLGSGQQKN